MSLVYVVIPGSSPRLFPPNLHPTPMFFFSLEASPSLHPFFSPNISKFQNFTCHSQTWCWQSSSLVCTKAHRLLRFTTCFEFLLFLFSSLAVAPDKGDVSDPSCFMSHLTFCLFHDRLLNAIKPGLVKKINRLPTPIAGLVSIQNWDLFSNIPLF